MTDAKRKRWWQSWVWRRRIGAAVLVLLPLVCVFAPAEKRDSCRELAREVRERGIKLLLDPASLLDDSAGGGAGGAP